MLAPMLRDASRASTAVVLLVALTGCAGIGQPAPYDSTGINGLVVPTPAPEASDFVEGVDNPWLALEPQARWHYDVTEAGRQIGTIDAEVLPATTEVAGLSATALHVTTEIDRDVEEETRLYAQDDDGNVWLVGVESGTGPSWKAGQGGAEAGLAMPARPRLGDGWLTYAVPGLTQASTTVEDQSREMVQTRDEAGATTRNVYEKGVGLVSTEDLDAGWLALLVE
jgi:hypothetical protein